MVIILIYLPKILTLWFISNTCSKFKWKKTKNKIVIAYLTKLDKHQTIALGKVIQCYTLNPKSILSEM